MIGKLLLEIFQAVWARMVSQTGKEEETASTQIREFEGHRSSPAIMGSEGNSPNQPKESSESPSSSRSKRSITAFLLPLLCPCFYIMAIVFRYFHKILCCVLYLERHLAPPTKPIGEGLPVIDKDLLMTVEGLVKGLLSKM